VQLVGTPPAVEAGAVEKAAAAAAPIRKVNLCYDVSCGLITAVPQATGFCCRDCLSRCDIAHFRLYLISLLNFAITEIKLVYFNHDSIMREIQN
jgi:hypothetical protein